MTRHGGTDAGSEVNSFLLLTHVQVQERSGEEDTKLIGMMRSYIKPDKDDNRVSLKDIYCYITRLQYTYIILYIVCDIRG